MFPTKLCVELTESRALYVKILLKCEKENVSDKRVKIRKKNLLKEIEERKKFQLRSFEDRRKDILKSFEYRKYRQRSFEDRKKDILRSVEDRKKDRLKLAECYNKESRKRGKEKTPLGWLAEEKGRGEKRAIEARVYEFFSQGPELVCALKVKRSTAETLVNIAAAVSMMKFETFKKIGLDYK